MRCKNCNKEFERQSTSSAIFCSSKCQRKYDYEQNKEKYLVNKRERYGNRKEEVLETAKYFRALKQGNIATDKIMSDVECAYVAGFWDGEGTIGLGRTPSRNGNTFVYMPRFDASNTNLEVLFKVREMMGFGRIGRQRRSTNKNHRTLYRLRVYSRQIKPVLSQFQKFFIVKTKQAQLLLEYFEFTEVNNYRNYTEEMRSQVSDIHRKLRILNSRGKVTYLPSI